MFRKLKKIKSEHLILFVLILAILHHFNFFLSIYDLSTKSHEQRMKFVYGDCSRESYGYLLDVERKFKFKNNIRIFNAESFPSSSWFFYKNNKKIDDDYLIILNYYDYAKLLDENRKTNIFFNDYDLSQFTILHRKENCLLLKRI